MHTHFKEKQFKSESFYMIFNELLLSKTGIYNCWGSVKFLET